MGRGAVKTGSDRINPVSPGGNRLLLRIEQTEDEWLNHFTFQNSSAIAE